VTESSRDRAVEPPTSILDAAPTGVWETEVDGMAVCFGAGQLARLGALTARHGTQVLLVTDPGLVSSGHVATALQALAAAGLEAAIFDDVPPNPTSANVEAGTRLALARSIQVIVALGGGSAMDCAKGINFLATNGGRMEDYWGFGKASRPMLPSLAVPTTAGTGSEAQAYALISDPESHRKMACGDPKARFRSVVLDPALLTSAPAAVAAAAGMDALSHALESHVTTRRCPQSMALSRRAFELLEPAVSALATPPTDVHVAGRALLGAHVAGAAIAASMLGAAHAAANPLTARHGILHGVAIGLMLPAVIRFNAEAADEGYRELWPAGALDLAGRVEEIRRQVGLPARLGDVGLSANDIPPLAAAAGEEWTGAFNPRPLGQSHFEDLYGAAL
jgi:alcohol dehydrogenase class IV